MCRPWFERSKRSWRNVVKAAAGCDVWSCGPPWGPERTEWENENAAFSDSAAWSGSLSDSNSLSLYAYQLKHRPELSFRWYSIILILYDAKANKASAPARTRTAYQDYCPRPWIRFKDICGDRAKEIIALTGDHYGTSASEVGLHGFHIDDDLSLREVLRLRTGESMPIGWPMTGPHKRFLTISTSTIFDSPNGDNGGCIRMTLCERAPLQPPAFRGNTLAV